MLGRAHNALCAQSSNEAPNLIWFRAKPGSCSSKNELKLKNYESVIYEKRRGVKFIKRESQKQKFD